MKKNKKVKMTFNIDPKVRRQIKNLVEDLGYKSESAFCCEAIEEYLSKLQYDSIGTYMNKCILIIRRDVTELVSILKDSIFLLSSSSLPSIMMWIFQKLNLKYLF